MLSQVSEHVSAGEVVHLWGRGLAANELCGCGLEFADCPFWAEVGRIGFGGWEQVDVREVLSLQRRVDRNRYIIFMIVPRLSRRYARDLASYVALLRPLYRAISEAADGSVVVDSSKHASTAFLLRRVEDLDLQVIHLVRDSRGVAYSLLKKVRRPEVVGDEAFMHSTPVWRSGTEWMLFNLLFHVLRLSGTPTTRVRYEDVVGDPSGAIRQLSWRPSGTSVDQLDFIRGHEVTLAIDHTVSGNPMRFRHGAFEIASDEIWRHSMGSRDRRLTSMLTWPLLKAYGYVGSRIR